MMSSREKSCGDPAARRPQLRVGRNTIFLLLVPVQALFFASALAMCFWAWMPWTASTALVVLMLSRLVPNLAPALCRGRVLGVLLAIGWLSTAVVLASMTVTGIRHHRLSSCLDLYFGGLGWLVGAGLFLGRLARAGTGWIREPNRLAIGWTLLGTGLWLAGAYKENLTTYFYLGLLLLLGLLVLCHFCLRLGTVGLPLINTLILLTVAIPLADFFVHPGYGLGNPRVRKKYWSYSEAKGDPTTFARWWSYYLGQWEQAEKKLMYTDPGHYPPFRPRPNSEAMLCQSRIRINSLGFRGKDIARAKGDAYRIVALGESTTFGITLNAEDRPWPERLEQMIRERLQPTRPVEVINAGVPGYHLDNNVERIPAEILPLQPDMIISYHGINGFIMLEGSLPSTLGASSAPRYQERPLRLLGDCEYRFKIIGFRKRLVAGVQRQPPAFRNPMKTPYAAAYRRLCALASTNRFHLVLTTFSMAVNLTSTPQAVEFYQVGYPAARWLIGANAVHSGIVQAMAIEYPEVCLVDTRRGLDGEHDKFLDLVHFAPPGEQQMAETVFEGIRDILTKDLSESHAGAAAAERGR